MINYICREGFLILEPCADESWWGRKAGSRKGQDKIQGGPYQALLTDLGSMQDLQSNIFFLPGQLAEMWVSVLQWTQLTVFEDLDRLFEDILWWCTLRLGGISASHPPYFTSFLHFSYLCRPEWPFMKVCKHTYPVCLGGYSPLADCMGRCRSAFQFVMMQLNIELGWRELLLGGLGGHMEMRSPVEISSNWILIGLVRFPYGEHRFGRQP